MAPKDITAHKQGKRHMAALAKVDETLPVKLKSEYFKAGAYDPEDTGVKSSTFSQSSTKAQKKNGKTAAKPKKGIKSIVPPPTSAVVDDQRLDGEHNGSFPSNTYIGSLDYSICDRDCGWCGQCMDDVSLEYISLFLLYYYYYYYTLFNHSEGEENGMED